MPRGRYFDGSSGAGREVELLRAGSALRMEGEAFVHEVPIDQLSFAPSRGGAPARIVIRTGGQCELPDSGETARLLAELGAAPSLVERLETHRAAILGALVAFVVLAATAWRWGIPLAADLLVDRAPPALDARIGETAVRQMVDYGMLTPSELPLQRQDAIRARFDALVKPVDAPRYAIRFYRLHVPNALAFPGGTIVVADELVDLSQGDADALMAVLGHELGHVRYRHSMRLLMRSALFSAAAAWYVGDFSSFAAGAAAAFAGLHYSRAAEHQSDLYAVQLMRANSVSTHGAALLMRRLADWRPGAKPGDSQGAPDSVRIPEYLSTHPDIEDRIRLFEAGGESGSSDESTRRP